MSNKIQSKRRSGAVFPYVTAVSINGLIWVLTILLVRSQWPSPTQSWAETSAILFGAASVALFVFSILIAMLAILGWKTAQAIIEERVKTETDKRVEDVTRELRGRALVTQGYLFGEMSIPPGKTEPAGEDGRNRLAEAVRMSNEGYEFLKGITGAEFMALNNVVYYSCALRDPNSNVILKQARRLKFAAEGHPESEGSAELLLTACRAILQYSLISRERQRAREILESLRDGKMPGASEKRRKEADLYLTSFSTPPNPGRQKPSQS
ncbi:MAG: hypothetical protein ACJ76J_18675 [Thermoanaerobaculia bacterium]